MSTPQNVDPSIEVTMSSSGSGPYTITATVTGGDAREYFRVSDFVETDTDYAVDTSKAVLITSVTETGFTGVAGAVPSSSADTVVRWRQIAAVFGEEVNDTAKRLLAVYSGSTVWFAAGNGSSLVGPFSDTGFSASQTIRAFSIGENTGLPVLRIGYATDSDGIIQFNTALQVAASAPASASDTGQAGTVAFDSDYIYYCVATDTWKRVAISTWP